MRSIWKENKRLPGEIRYLKVTSFILKYDDDIIVWCI